MRLNAASRPGNDANVTDRLRSQVGAIGQNLEPERAPFSHLAIDADAALVELNRVLHDGEPQPRAAQRPRPALVDPVEALEEARQMLGLDAPARIENAHADGGRGPLHADRDRARVRVL